MKFHDNFRRIILPVCVLVLMSFGASFAKTQDDAYRFKVHNTTQNTIKKVLVSEDGKKYGYFDIGKGIPPGRTVELVWDKSTNGQSCHQFFKAVFDDGEETRPVKFDFCEEGLELEF